MSAARVVALPAHKGGCGKTVTTMALGAALARSGSRTLIIDLDPQAHSTMGLGIEVGDGAPTIRDLFADPPQPIDRLIRRTHLAGLDLVPSTIRLERVAHVLYVRPRREELLARACRAIRDAYAYLVVDCPPSLGPLTEMAITAADLVIVPCQMEARVSDAVTDVLEVIAILKGVDWEGWRILHTRVDVRKSVTNEAARAALARWRDHWLVTAIPQSEPLNQAQIERTDIFTFAPRSAGALAYDALATEVRALTEPTDVHAAW